MSSIRIVAGSIGLVASVGLLAVPIWASGPAAPPSAACDTAQGDCTPCHTCDSPTREQPCLRTCPRILPALAPAAPANQDPPRTPPDQVMLEDLEDLYLPVPFDHKGHASMSEISTGCDVCHHYTPEGQAHPACRSCHSVTQEREDIRQPGLKGAYHRQCLSCHREWSHDTACSLCHVPKLHRGIPTEPDDRPCAAEVVNRMSPPVAGKTTYVFTTSEAPSPVVTFHHADHAQTFGVRCVQCHRGASCGSCHDQTIDRSQNPVHSGAQHLKNTCFTCHQESNCGFCHDEVERTSFSHSAHGGWPLEPFHANVACGDCHGPVTNMTTPSKACKSCHERLPTTLDGDARKALAVSGTASDGDCLTCHVDRAKESENAKCVHGPVSDGSGCRTCHPDPHMQPEGTPRDDMSAHCLGCHDRPIDTGDGRVLEDIASTLADHSNRHGPVREGNCVACHEPHCSEHARLLTGEYAAGFYAPFKVKNYELCFGCHNQDQVLLASGSSLTGFRNGDANLHWLHVNKEKGRTCRACHEVHASDQPFHIRESVPFGNSGWTLPINYHQTADGGTCAPGCHAPKSYTRGDGNIAPTLPGQGDTNRTAARTPLRSAATPAGS